jgi:hypothetical protein
MRRKTAQDTVVSKAVLWDLEGFMSPETITNQNTWSMMCPRSGLRIKYTAVEWMWRWSGFGVIIAYK